MILKNVLPSCRYESAWFSEGQGQGSHDLIVGMFMYSLDVCIFNTWTDFAKTRPFCGAHIFCPSFFLSTLKDLLSLSARKDSYAKHLRLSELMEHLSSVGLSPFYVISKSGRRRRLLKPCCIIPPFVGITKDFFHVKGVCVRVFGCQWHSIVHV